MGFFWELASLLLLRFWELYEGIFGAELHLEMIVGNFRGPRKAFSGFSLVGFSLKKNETVREILGLFSRF